jgi:UV DNA damage endonuclease
LLFLDNLLDNRFFSATIEPIINQVNEGQHMVKRVGFACKYSEFSSGKIVSSPELNCGTTTIAWLSRQTHQKSENRLIDLMKGNIESVKKLVMKVSTFPEELRLVRISSDVLPAYTHKDWMYFWKQPDIVRYMEREFGKIGDIARLNDVRLSFHPGQYCCLASENPGIVENSIAEFEYHADIIRMMGYGKRLQDFKCNIHVAGKRGPIGMREAYNKLSVEARNTITVENEENTWGLDHCLELADIIPVVLDIHHHFVREGEYISTSDDRIKKIIESWCRDGVDKRPVFHYSMSREDVLLNHDVNSKPDMNLLLEQGHKKQFLRAHSDAMWNRECNRWAFTHWQYADCMVEAKNKNIASFDLYKQFKSFEKE